MKRFTMLYYYSSKIYLILGLLFCVVFANANNIRQITNRDGLSNSAILSILQDREGYVWFGTCDGLNLFNGLHPHLFKPSNNNHNLSGNIIENLIEAEDNILWVYTNYGLNRLNKKTGKITIFDQFKGLYFIDKDIDNRIFIIKESNKIYCYNKVSKVFELISLPGVTFQQISGFTITSQNKIFIFQKNGKNFCFNINQGEHGKIKLVNEQIANDFGRMKYCFHEKGLPDVIYYVDDKDILYEFNFLTNKKIYVYSLKDEIQERGIISSIIKHHDDYYISFKTNGVIRLTYTSDKVDKYNISDIGIKSGVFCMLKDKYQDLIWIGTDGQGVYMLSKGLYKIQSYTFRNNGIRVEKPVRALFKDAANTLWIGTKGDGVVCVPNFGINGELNSDLVRYFTTGNSELADNQVYAFEKSKHNILWIGTESGISYYSFHEKTMHKMNLIADKLPVKYIHGICELNDSTLWLATVGTGIVKLSLRWHNHTPQIIASERLLVLNGIDFQNYFFTLYNDQRNGRLWFGNRGYGAYFLNKNRNLETLRNIDYKNHFHNQSANDIYAITCDAGNNLWLGTSLGLIKQTPSGKVSLFDETNGLPNNTVHSFLPDNNGNLWLSTNRGIVRFNTKLNSLHTYNQFNGLQVLEYSDGASFKDEDSGSLYFGGINGFVTIYDTGDSTGIYQPPILFSNLAIFGNQKNINDYITLNNGQKYLKLTYRENFFSLSLVALDYINGNDYNYYYQLDGLSKEWINNGFSNQISFTSIPSGTYTLKAKYRNKLSGYESPVYTIIIRITPPWYASNWAYALYTILFLFLISMLVRAAYVKDIKKKRKALYKLQQQHQEDIHESKLRFFTNIAHEFCSPLTLIYGPCDRIIKYSQSDSYVVENARLIQRNAERMNRLIQNLIEFRRIETGNQQPKIESVDVNSVIEEICDSFKNLISEKNITFVKNIQSKLDWNTDYNFLYTILINLISNAIKYVNENGRIEIEAKHLDDRLCFSIQNSGQGIKEEDLSKIFNRYTILDNFENRENIKGSYRNGLGLAISYNMVQLLNGRIDVSSEVGVNTRFSIEIPSKEIDENTSGLTIKVHDSLRDVKHYYEREEDIQIPYYEFDKGKQTMLVIDDDAEILWLICDIFKNEYNVIPVDDSTWVFEQLNIHIPDVIICDVLMPGYNGIELAKEIKNNKKYSHIPLILISAKHSVEDQIAGLDSGAQMYIAKPFDPNYLKASVSSLLSVKDTLKDYFDSPISAFVIEKGKLEHKENVKFLSDVLDVIEKNITETELSNQFIAEKLNMSSRHLSRKISQLGAESPSFMIRECRLLCAQKMLLKSQMTIDEIIYKSGFSNRSTFFRLFMSKYGCTPKEYRENGIENI